jgi:DNA ligase (NAD+)
LEILLKVANALYRSGYPIIEDKQYDEYLNYFKTLDPENPFLLSVEPEVLIDSKTVPLPKKMLSTDKAYSLEEIKKWTERITKAASEIEFDQNLIEIKVTPKLDGYAAYDDGTTLYTRGDGTRGQDITRAFERGLKVAKNAGRGLGPGEIVIKKSYFNRVLMKSLKTHAISKQQLLLKRKLMKMSKRQLIKVSVSSTLFHY